MSEAEEYFHQISAKIEDVKPGKMFGAQCLKTPNGKAGAMFWRDFLVVKLQGEDWKEAMSLDGAQLFDPMDGRPMKEWVQIPFDYKEQWMKFIQISVDGVKTLKGKK